MTEGMALGFIVAGEPKIVGSGGPGGQPRGVVPGGPQPKLYEDLPYTQAELDAAIEHLRQDRRTKAEMEAELMESLNKVAGIWNMEKLDPQRMAAVMFYITEHCLDRLTELLAFFGEEFGAIVSEALEATDDKGGDSDE